MDDLKGKRLGNYQVIETVGKGGMAQVYRAYQPSTDRDVALKILPDDLAHDDSFLKRFRQEATIIAKLQHPHILPIYDFGEAEGYTFIVMPLVTGGTLTDMLDAKPLSLIDVRRITSQIGSALDYAHERGLIHRDVKPGNILIDETGNTLLSDFGLVKEVEGGANLTESGMVMGTPAYMSPEQGLGKAIDKRSDIYALGIILYEMATGQVPFTADTPMGVVVKHINDPLPPPRKVNPTLSVSIERIIQKSLAKHSEDRYTSAGELVKAIQSAIPESGEIPTIMDDSDVTVLGDVSEATEITGKVPRRPHLRVSRQWMVLISVLVALVVVSAAAVLIVEDESSSSAINRVCLNVPFPGVWRGTFDGEIWHGVQEVAARYDAEAVVRTIAEEDGEPDRFEEAFSKNLDELMAAECDLIIASGFSITTIIAEAARANPELSFQVLDASYDPPIDNIWAQDYATDEGAFLAGYVAASVTQTGKVGTYGGFQFPSIEFFMDGFARGVAHYNEQNGTDVEVLGWDIGSRTGFFVESFGPPEDAYDLVNELIEDGVDIILPVAGGASHGAGDIALQHEDVYVIGVDSDWVITNPEYASVTLTSIEKRFNLSVLSALTALENETFEGGTHLGTVANGEIGITSFREFNDLVPVEVDADLIDIKAGIVAGRIQTRPLQE